MRTSHFYIICKHGGDVRAAMQYDVSLETRRVNRISEFMRVSESEGESMHQHVRK